MARTEHDLIGSKSIDPAAYYGIQTQRAVENFPITGQRLHPALISAVAVVKKTAAMANESCGLLPSHISEAIAKACDEVISGKFNDQFVVDPIQGGAGTSINMNANEVIANRAIEHLGSRRGNYLLVHPNTHVNMSQSTNDVIPTAVRVALLTLIEGSVRALDALVAAFRDKESEFNEVVKLGRTHLQDAVPIRLGQEFGAYARVIARDRERIGAAAEGLLRVNLGATAVGTGLNADPAYIQRAVQTLGSLTGFPFIAADHLVDGTQMSTRSSPSQGPSRHVP
jgi:aspartate ammonia-lyase